MAEDLQSEQKKHAACDECRECFGVSHHHDGLI